MSSNKPKLVVLNSNYPSKENLYGAVFVHSRLKHYLSTFDIVVLGYRPQEQDNSFVHEGLTVFNYSSKESFVEAIRSNRPDVMAIHFAGGWFYKAFLKDINIPVFIWIHGEEALGWYRRLYYFNYKTIHKLLVFAIKNIYQLYNMRRIIRDSNKKGIIKFVFVSEWMKKIAETDTLIKVNHSYIIPNPIDTDLFRFTPKPEEFSRKMLMIRSFETNKYANDVAIEAIQILRSRPVFENLQIEIYGKGQFFHKLTAPISGLANVKLNNRFMENHLIPTAHKDYGIFLCPTRQDAQGVSMCEAMSSGLVPVTSDNTAIPEFVEDGESGFLTKNASDVAAAIEKLANDGSLFQKMSETASSRIREKAGHKNVIAEELKILMEGVRRNEFS